MNRKKDGLAWRTLNWILPSFTELHLTAVLTIIAAVIVTDDNARHAFAQPDIIALLIPTALLIFTLVVFLKLKPSNSTKEFLVTVYYAFIAAMAGISLRNHVRPFATLPLLECVNLFLIGFLFVTAVTRFAFAWFLNDGKSTRMDKVISMNFKDDQYRYAAHIITAVLAAVGVALLSRMYESTATVAILTFGYLSIFFSLLDSVLHASLVYPEEES